MSYYSEYNDQLSEELKYWKENFEKMSQKVVELNGTLFASKEEIEKLKAENLRLQQKVNDLTSELRK